MKLKRSHFLLGAAVSLALVGPALAGYFGGLPAQTTMTGAETIPFDTNKSGGASPQTAVITSADLAGYAQGTTSLGLRNALIGGDFGTNLWQRGTTGTATTTALTYGPDRWWALSGTNTEVKIIKETTSLTPGFAGSARFQRTAAQTGVVASCMGQVLSSPNSTRFQGKKVEFSFYAKVGANFSASLSHATATIATGTGANESAANFSTGAWTGQATAVAQTLTLTTSWARYSAVATLPATETQVGVKICFTPVGTAGANDWLEITGAQLDANAAARTSANFAAFDFRPAHLEGELQRSYFYRLVEPASGAAIDGMCQAVGANTNICNVFLPTTMRSTTPTITITTAGTFKVNIAGTPTTIATPTASTCGSNACAVTAANTNTAGQAELLSGGGGSGAWDISAEL